MELFSVSFASLNFTFERRGKFIFNFTPRLPHKDCIINPENKTLNTTKHRFKNVKMVSNIKEEKKNWFGVLKGLTSIQKKEKLNIKEQAPDETESKEEGIQTKKQN